MPINEFGNPCARCMWNSSVLYGCHLSSLVLFLLPVCAFLSPPLARAHWQCFYLQSLSLSLSVQTYLLTVTLLGAAKNCHCNQMVPYCVTESGHYLLRERLFVKSISHCNQMPLYHVTVTGVSVSECVCISFLLSLFLSFGHCCRPSLSLSLSLSRSD